MEKYFPRAQVVSFKGPSHPWVWMEGRPVDNEVNSGKQVVTPSQVVEGRERGLFHWISGWTLWVLRPRVPEMNACNRFSTGSFCQILTNCCLLGWDNLQLKSESGELFQGAQTCYEVIALSLLAGWRAINCSQHGSFQIFKEETNQQWLMRALPLSCTGESSR